VFLWSDKRDANDISIGGAVIVEVDANNIPCDGGRSIPNLVGPLTGALTPGLFSSSPHRDLVDFDKEYEIRTKYWPEEIKTRVEHIWEVAEKYNGETIPTTEVWFDCVIPPEAIVDVWDPDGIDYEFKGKYKIDTEETDLVREKTKQLYDKHKKGFLTDRNIESIFIYGDHVSGGATAGVSPLQMSIVIEGSIPAKSGNRDHLTDMDTDEIDNRDHTEINMHLESSKIVGEMIDRIPEVKLSLSQSKTSALEPAMREYLKNDMDGEIAIDIINKSRLKPGGVENIMERDELDRIVYEVEFGHVQDTNEQIRVVNDFIQNEFNMDPPTRGKRERR
jgi:hypothetical protein